MLLSSIDYSIQIFDLVCSKDMWAANSLVKNIILENQEVDKLSLLTLKKCRSGGVIH